MKSYGYIREAENELTDALARSPNSSAFYRKVDKAINEIIAGLIQYARYGRTNARVCPLHHLPYSLVYVDRGNSIEIIAVAHHKRRPGYWKSRLKKS